MIRRLPPLQVAVVVSLLASAWPPSRAEAVAQGPDLRVQRAGPDTLIVPAGERASVAFRFTNTGPGTLDLRPRAALPDGWRMAVEPPPFVLGAGEGVLRVLSFVVPAGADPGSYTVSLHAGTTGGGSMHGSVTVRVPETHRLSLEIVDEPASATPGESYRVRLLASNRGNVVTTVRLEAPGNAARRVRILPGLLRLAPDAAADVEVEITPASGDRSASLASLRILAITNHDTVTVISRVRQVPTGRSDGGRVGIPGELRLRASPDGRSGSPVRFRAAGPVRPGSRTRADLLLEGPSRGLSVFGAQDVYRLRLSDPRFSLVLGDDVYRLSRLTEPGREGLGAGFSARAGAFESGAFAQRNRRSSYRDERAGAFLAVRPLPRLGFRGNWFRADSDLERREVMSAEADLRLPGATTAHAEVGLRPERGAAARSVEMSAGYGPVRLRLSGAQIDSSYGGPQAGMRREAVHLTFRPLRSLGFDGSMDAQRVERTVAGLPRVIHRRSILLAARWGSWMVLETRRLEQESAGTDRSHARDSESVALGVRLPVGLLHLHSRVEAGEGVERTSDGEPGSHASGFRRVSAGADLRTGIATLTSRVERFSGGSLHRLEPGAGTSVAVSAALRLAAATQLSVSARETRYGPPLERGTRTLLAAAEHRFRNGHGLAARLDARSHSGTPGFRRNTLALDYTLPMRLPLPGSGGGATMSGRLYDEVSGDPLKGAIIRVGSRSVLTDARGHFQVRGLDPGAHRLDVESASIPAGTVAGVRLPLTVEVLRGTGALVEVPFVRPGALTVATRLAHSTARGGAIDEEPLAGAVLEFRRGEERFLRTTGAAGRVELRDLRPGRWLIGVVSATVPAFHRFRETEVEIEVGPGDSATVELVATAIERRIEMVASAELAVSDGEPPAGWTRLRISSRTTLREVATRVYGDPDLWPRIRDANAALAHDPDAIPVGTLLLIPPRDGPLAAATPGFERKSPPRPPVLPPEHRAVSADAPFPGSDVARPPAPAPPRIAVDAPPTTIRQPYPSISTTAQDRTLQDLARVLYGDERLWVRIWLANREMLPGTGELYAGMVLRIPPGGPPTPEELRIHEEHPRR